MENRTNKRMQWVIRFGCILGLMTALCGCSSTEVVKVAKYAAKEALKTTAHSRIAQKEKVPRQKMRMGKIPTVQRSL
jgi:hypothetical protein